DQRIVRFPCSDQCRRCPIAENGSDALIEGVDELAVSIRRNQEKPAGLSGFDQAFRQSQAIDVARAAEVEIKRPTAGSQPQPLLEQTRGRGQVVIRALRAIEEEIDLVS